MLSEFLLQFKTQFSFFNLFEYLTFKTAISAITALVVSFVIGPIIIKTLKKYQKGETIEVKILDPFADVRGENVVLGEVHHPHNH